MPLPNGISEKARLGTRLCSSPRLIVDKPLVCQRICPTACLRTVSPTAAQCSGAAHCVCSRLQPLRGLQRPAFGAGMHFYPQFAIVDPHRTQSVLVALVAHWAYFGLFPPQAAASVRPAKNARNDVHAVISDLSFVLPILCQGSVRSPAFSLAGGCALLKGKIACYTSRCGGYTIHRQMVRQGDSAARQSCQFNNISKRDFRSEHKDSFRVEAENA